MDTSDTYPPLPESAFRRVIAENYVSSNSAQFSFELDMEQVARLSEAFKQFAVNRTTPVPPSVPQNVLSNFPAPSPSNAPQMLDRPSQAWLSEKTRRLSPVGRRHGLEYLSFGRPKSSMDYLGHQPPHFETDLGILGGTGSLQPRLSIDVNSLSSSHLNALSSLFGANTTASTLLGGGASDPLAAQQALGGNSRLFPNDASNWKAEGMPFAGLMPPASEMASPQLFGQTQIGLAPDNPTAAPPRMSVGRLSPGHLSPDLDTWNVDTANAFKIAAQRLTPDIHISQAAASNISAEERRRSNIWQVNSKDMGLVDAQKFLSGMSGFPELQDALHDGSGGLNGQRTAELAAALQEPSRVEGLDALWSGPANASWKPPRPHSSTDGEVQSLTQNLQNMWSDAKVQVIAASQAAQDISNRAAGGTCVFV